MALQTKTYTKGSTTSSELRYYQLELILEEISVDESSNTSEVYYKFQLHSGNTAFTTWTTTRKLILNGNTIKVETSQLSIERNSTLVYFEGTTYVEHNSDGTLDMAVEASIDMTEESQTFIPGDVTLSGTMTLTPISVEPEEPVSDGTVRVYDGSAFKTGVRYIHDGTGWKKGVHYIHDGTAWKRSE